MGKQTGIAWCDHTFNPWWGCVEVSPGCDHCYAKTFDARFGGEHWGAKSPRRFFGDKHWNEPHKWNRDARERYAETRQRTYVFCASMADVFESGRAELEPHRERLWDLIRQTPSLTWLLLTKRPQNIDCIPDVMYHWPNVWYGTTVESPQYLWRVEKLLEEASHAPVRFVSMEPYLERAPAIAQHLGARGINWVIAGSESGDGARETPIDNYRELAALCAGRSAFFFKQAPKGAPGITVGEGSYEKRDLRTGPDGIKRVHWMVERPYLDGVQYAHYPEGT